MTQQYCPACGDPIVQPDIQGRSFLIIEELAELVYPEKMKSKYDNDFTVREILKIELQKVGLMLQQFDIVQVYPHVVPENGMPNENCFDAGLDYATDLLVKYKGVIVLGGNLCKIFTGYEINKVQGLTDVESKYIPSGMPRMFLNKMQSFYAVGNGEFELGFKRFAEQVYTN